MCGCALHIHISDSFRSIRKVVPWLRQRTIKQQYNQLFPPTSLPLRCACPPTGYEPGDITPPLITSSAAIHTIFDHTIGRHSSHWQPSTPSLITPLADIHLICSLPHHLHPSTRSAAFHTICIHPLDLQPSTRSAAIYTICSLPHDLQPTTLLAAITTAGSRQHCWQPSTLLAAINTAGSLQHRTGVSTVCYP